MKLTGKIGNYTVEVDGADVEELFRNMAEVQELLSFGLKCEQTGATDIIMKVRKSGEFEFFEFASPSEGTSLSLGHAKAGGMFAKRKGKDGSWLDHGGWLTWKQRKAIQEGGKVKSGKDDYDPNF